MAGLSVRATTRAITAGVRPSPKDEIRAVVRALNKTAAQARTSASRDVRAAGYNIKASAIKRSFTIDRATPPKLSVTLRATGLPITLINYGVRQTKKGVTAGVKNGPKTLKYAFIATMPNGIDPVAEKQGAVLGMDEGLSTLEMECVENTGEDCEDILDQRAREVKAFKDRDLPVPQWAGMPPANTAAQTPQASQPR